MAGGKGDSPHISEFSVRKMLESMLYKPGAKKRDVSPLEHLAVIDAIVQDPATPTMERGRLFALEQFLVELITDYYLKQRSAEGLPPLAAELSRAAALADLDQVKLTGRTELEAWAILYYRFVQIDLSFTVEEIRTALVLEERTYRRHYVHAIKRMCVAMRQREQEARRQNKQNHLLARLPGDTEWRIVGRQSLIEDTVARIKEMPHTFMVSGLIGAGKRSLVRAVVAELIQENLVDQVLWLDSPRSVEQVRLRLLEMAAPYKHNAERIDMRAYLLRYRTVVVLAEVPDLTVANAEWNALLLDLDAATVFVIDHQYTPMDALTAHLPLGPLDTYWTLELARLWRARFHRGDSVSEDELRAIADQSGGFPGVLRRMIAEYGHALPETLFEASIGRAYGDTLALLSPLAREALFRFTLVPAQIEFPGHLGSVLDWDVRAGMDELLRHHLLEWRQSPERFQIAAHMRDWIEQDYRQGGVARSILDHHIATFDAVLTHDADCLLPIVEHVLTEKWLIIPAVRRQMWVRASWRAGVKANHWALWLELLRLETEQEDHRDAALWVGRGVCARWLALWEESAHALGQAIALAGDVGDFVVQAEAELELSILKRLLSQYEDAQRHQTRVSETAERFGLDSMLERASIEQAQIALECGDGQLTLDHLRAVPLNARIQLMRAEARLLLGDAQGSLAELSVFVTDGSDDNAVTGKAYALMGRSLFEIGNYAGARVQFERAITILEKTDDPYSLGRAYANLAGLLIDSGHERQAFAMLKRAEAMQKQIGDRVALFATQHNLRVLHGRIRHQ